MAADHPNTAPTVAGKTAGVRAGYVYLHSAVDGYSRLAYTEHLLDETAATTIEFFHRASAFLAAHREAGDVLHTYVELSRPAEWIDSIDFTDSAAINALVAAEFDGWAPELTALLTDGETPPVPRMIHGLPDAHRWERVPGVTLIGDAAHLMPPSGEGANLAMFDGAELGKAIAAHPDDVEAALADHEVAMFPRSEAEAVRSHVIQDLCLGDRAPFGLIDFFTGVNRHDPG